jgi:hypothetical protein
MSHHVMVRTKPNKLVVRILKTSIVLRGQGNDMVRLRDTPEFSAHMARQPLPRNKNSPRDCNPNLTLDSRPTASLFNTLANIEQALQFVVGHSILPSAGTPHSVHLPSSGSFPAFTALIECPVHDAGDRASSASGKDFITLRLSRHRLALARRATSGAR